MKRFAALLAVSFPLVICSLVNAEWRPSSKEGWIRWYEDGKHTYSMNLKTQTVLKRNGKGYVQSDINSLPKDAVRELSGSLKIAERQRATASPTRPASQPFRPQQQTLREEDLKRLAASICPEEATSRCLGMLAAFNALTWNESCCIAAKERLTREEYFALANFCLHGQFGKTGWATDYGPYFLVEQDHKDADEFVRSAYFLYDALNGAKRDGDETITRNFRERLGKDPDTVSKTGASYQAWVAELRRYRRDGATKHNRPYVVETAQPSLRTRVPAAGNRYRVGDKVCNPGFLRTWEGTITKVDGDVHHIRMDYVNRKLNKKLFESLEYSFVLGEFKPCVNRSINSLLSR
ncbi:MAG: hypothetical protein O3C40_30715 [Planctomycetota bacterium]|nr:hypothetical protein [Planctomycetota bacterium]